MTVKWCVNVKRKILPNVEISFKVEISSSLAVSLEVSLSFEILPNVEISLEFEFSPSLRRYWRINPRWKINRR